MKEAGPPGTERKAANRTGSGGWERTAVSVGGWRGDQAQRDHPGRGAQNQVQEAEERTWWY